jgi:hypothetical protein
LRKRIGKKMTMMTTKMKTRSGKAATKTKHARTVFYNNSLF